MNPKDIMTDAIHNFHPQYQQYTQYSSGMYDLFLFLFKKGIIVFKTLYLFYLINTFSYSMM